MDKGRFTLPGESGYEALTLSLARRWGADVIRDSDGTELSAEILDAGYSIYSTLCPIRGHNAWLKENLWARQQTFLCSKTHVAGGETLQIDPMEGFFRRQFAPNTGEDALRYWQAYDRTTGKPLPRAAWRVEADTGLVRIETTPFHRYTVSFLAWRLWEEISMYNYITNGWDGEPLMPLDPYTPDARAYLLRWLGAWCEKRPHTDVVRFTSLFYNFVWIWGDDPDNRSLFTDWASYDFTVSPLALDDFAAKYGYTLEAEDFVRGGRYCATHTPPSQAKRDWMAFIGSFVRDLGRECVEIVHRAEKRAYVFYDDSWVGLEPYSGHFEAFGFDGIIKCVFSGYEARMCAGVRVATHEIRLHPYLFPTGLGGAPTFAPGGNPAADAQRYWVSVRRALLRQPIDRAGLGGYLHLLEGQTEFLDAIDGIVTDFRAIRALHEQDTPLTLRPRVGILHAWGALRTWTLSGHFHETDEHVLIHLLESLSGLPVSVRFLSFDDVRGGVPQDIDVLINAGEALSSWSGADAWDDAELATTLTEWVHAGGIFLGVREPSAGADESLRMAHVLGVDLDSIAYSCHGRWPVAATPVMGLIPEGVTLHPHANMRLSGPDTRVLAADGNAPLLTLHPFGKGAGVYVAGYEHNAPGTRFWLNLLRYAMEGVVSSCEGMTDNPLVEAALFKQAGRAIVVNNADAPQDARLRCRNGWRKITLPAYGMTIISLVEGES